MLLAAGHSWRPDHGLGKWTGALIAVVALHAGAVATALITWQSVTPPTPPPAAIMIELMPLPVSPPAPVVQAAQETSPVEKVPEIELPVPEIDTVPPMIPQPELTLPIPEIDMVPPTIPEPEVVLPKPAPEKPKEQIAEKPKEKPKDKPKEKPKEKPKPETKPDPEADQTVVQNSPPQPSQQAAKAAAPVQEAAVAAAPSAADVARAANAKVNWEGLLQAHLKKHLKYPKSARRRHEQGTSFVFIRMSRDGEVLAYSLETASGYEALDEEAMKLIERAQPLPPLPEDMPGAAIKFTIPIDFNLTN